MPVRHGLSARYPNTQSLARRLRPKSVRAKVVALLMVPVVSLMVLWALATVSTVQDAWTLRQLKELNANLTGPVAKLVASLQAERAAVALYLSSNGTGDQAGLAQRHGETEGASRGLQDGVARTSADLASLAPEVSHRLDGVTGDVGRLQADQAAIAARQKDWQSAFDAYGTAIQDAFAVESALTDVQSGGSAKVVVPLAQIGEMLARQDAVATSANANGRMTADQYRSFTDALGGQQVLTTNAVPDLRADARAAFGRLAGGSAYASLTGLQNALRTDMSGRATAVAVGNGAWRAAVDPVTANLRTITSDASAAATSEADSAGDTALTQGAVTVILGLAAVLAALVISVRIGRGLVVELVGLRDSALELARHRLPRAMLRLRAGESIDVDADVPVVTPGDGEIGQVGDALNAVQRSALQAAAERAELLHGVSGVFVTLARRSQSLVHRQLSLLDAMERRTEDPAELEDLYRLDHLAARMRRHAEGLIIMSGAAPGRAWSNPVPLMTVIRAAVAEVEEFQRVEVRRMPEVSVQGSAVADLTHMIAELVENATSFSPPNTVVLVHGEPVGAGFVVEIEDRGLGMKPATMAEANQRIAQAHQLDLFDRDQLGFYVVSRLANRQNIGVTLRRSAYGGTTAVLLLPAAILTRYDPVTGFEERPRRARQPSVVSAPSVRVDPQPRHAAVKELPRAAAPDPKPPPVPPPAVAPPGDDRTGGLPRRTRQASLAPGLRGLDPRGGDDATAQPSPDQARATMSALQQGFHRGRQR